MTDLEQAQAILAQAQAAVAADAAGAAARAAQNADAAAVDRAMAQLGADVDLAVTALRGDAAGTAAANATIAAQNAVVTAAANRQFADVAAADRLAMEETAVVNAQTVLGLVKAGAAYPSAVLATVPPDELQFVGALPQAQAARLYQAAFARAPDAVGERYWTDALNAGETLQKIALDFTLTPEGLSHFGAASNQDFIGQLYQNVLGRAGEAAGAAYWTDALDHGYGRGDALAAFSESPENVAGFTGRVAAGTVHVSF